MLTLTEINSLNLNTLQYLDEESLVLPATLKKLAEISEDPQFEQEPGQARDFFEALRVVINQNAQALQANPSVYNQLVLILWKLSWKAFSALGSKVRKSLIAEHLTFSVKNKIDVKTYLSKYLSVYEFIIGPDKEERRDWTYALENNKETIGREQIVLENSRISPTVQNWLKAYNAAQSLSNARSKFNQINFLDTDQSARKLSKEDREVLEEVIKIYDWLLFPPPGPEIVADDSTVPVSSATPTPLPPVKKATPFVSAEKFNMHAPLPPPAPESPLVIEQEQAAAAPSIAPVALPKFSPPPGAVVPPARPVNVQDVINKRQKDQPQAAGLDFGSNKITPIPELKIKELDNTEERINKKLEELKKKKQGNSQGG